ncbi:hypothetical protein D6827_02580 [Candidatus Parcubacteria bacterium]|nr:MAG: hypothetical protein D6827_02580 [Candidatus Parcubacteria bacterium]
MKYAFGRTNIEIIFAVALTVVIFFFAALFANPWEKAQKAQDDILANGVRNYMEALIEVSQNDPGLFWEIAYSAYDTEKEIGSCTECVDLAGLSPKYFGNPPIDENSGGSKEKSGYYILFKDNVLEIGALHPRGDTPIRLMWFVK